MSVFSDKMKALAKSAGKTLVLAEGMEERTVRAARMITDEGIAKKVILVGKKDDVVENAKKFGVDLDGIEISDPTDSSHFEEFANEYYNLRKHKGMTIEQARVDIVDQLRWGAMLVHTGYADAMVKHRLNTDPSLVVPSRDFTKEEGFRQMSALIDKGFVPDALFCFNDQLAIGAMRSLLVNGIRVPQQVSVMGFSESQSALVTVPALSSVAQPLEDIGKTAARLLLDKIENPDSKSVKKVLNASLNIRGSSDPDRNPLL